MFEQSTQIDNRTNSFTFTYDDLYGENETTCDIKITVKTMQYTESKSIYYYIEYDNIFPKNEINKAHPFYFEKKFHEHLDGDIIYKNPMTENLVKMLLMDNDELSKYSDHVCPETYRKSLMKCIVYLFD
jgi:hypothetical protein